MENKIDFSSLGRLTPHADSWEKVCARLDAQSNKIEKRAIPFFKAIPLAAALVFAAIGIYTVVHSNSSEKISIESIMTDEVSAWYNNLGVSAFDSAGVIDDFESLDESITLSYFYKE